MGVKVRLADGREVIDAEGNAVKVAAGEVVELDEGTARVMRLQNLVTSVQPSTKVTAGQAAAATAAAAGQDGKKG